MQWLQNQEGDAKIGISSKTFELGHCVRAQGKLKMAYKYGNRDPDPDNQL
jgi:hypothetical protein